MVKQKKSNFYFKWTDLNKEEQSSYGKMKDLEIGRGTDDSYQGGSNINNNHIL